MDMSYESKANNNDSADMQMADKTGDAAKTAWVAAEIKSVTPATRVVSAEHETVPEWQWPSMTMNFFVAEAVEIDQLQAGTQLHMQIAMRADGQYEISAVHIVSQPESPDQSQQPMIHNQ
jgi:Cu(I)/Ag(I) efflux system membrane fusion protein